ncbi:MAG: mercuric transporter MerT family protein [Gracilimonas sp.]|uniref:mercuric transporter MerT family protein n=1 Tax=Gracilimonas sp. TaxID=1974203 RepID=UPI003752D3EE|nr:mercuric transporter MerT family protein [Gracilimonas sp.]
MKNQKSHNSDTKWMGAGLLAAFAASLCCITPVAAFLAGIGGIGSMFAWIEPFRPWLIGITVLILGFAWYRKLKLQWEPECACEANPSFWQSKSFLGIVTVLTAGLLAFPTTQMHSFPIRSKATSSMFRKVRLKALP